MADLKNSQRISYKATYNQISPGVKQTETPHQPPPAVVQLKRGLEKAAFVQSLQVRPQELSGLKGTYLERSHNDATRKEAIELYNAIELLVNDGSASSTLNNASNFSSIHYESIAEFANALLEYRQRISSGIDAAVVQIVSAYKESLHKSSADKLKGTVVEAPPPRATENVKTETSTNAAGIPITAMIFPVTSRAEEKGKDKRQMRSMRTRLSVDESKSSFSPVISEFSKAAADTMKMSTRDAIVWAESNQAGMFNNLYDAVQPYTSAGEGWTIRQASSLLNFMRDDYARYFDHRRGKGAIAGFETRMAVEPVGFLHLERIEMYPSGIERGELVHSVPLAPSETVNISHKEWSVRQQEFEEIVQDYFEGYSEEGVSEKNDLAMSNESQSKHATALNIGASLSASYSSITLSTSFGYNATSDDQQSKKDSRNHSMTITKKASARTKKDHKVTFKVSSVVGSEDQSVRVITNPSDTDAMRIDYFQMARKWKADLLRYGLRMTYDIVIPDPGSALITKVRQVKDLDAIINVPFTFSLPLTAITYNSLATDPHYISNYDQLAAQYDATVTAPPEAIKWVNVHKEIPEVQSSDYDHVHFDSVDFEIDENYYIHEVAVELDCSINDGDDGKYFLQMLGRETIWAGLQNLIGKSGKLSIDIEFQYVWTYAINVTFKCRPKIQMLLDWRLQVWNQIRQAAEEHYYKSIQNYKDQRAQLVAEINNYDALSLRRMEQEEIMKGVMRWILGPNFYLVPPNIASLFGSDSNDPEVQDVLDPNKLSDSEWKDVLEHGEFIKYIHNAIEWENVLYFTYPYFWDDNRLWDFKKFLFHPDQTHKVFLRSGAARVVLTIRPGFESSFTQLVENGAFGSLPAPHPYVTIAQEIQNFAKTNYPGFPPANPEQNARPLLYLEQRRVWKEMQFIIQLLDAFKADAPNDGHFPASVPGNAVPVADLTPYLDGPITIAGINYNGVNDFNSQANAKQLLLDPNTPLEALLPTYTNVPANDYWGNAYFYKSPGDTGDYDLISFGEDGAPGGIDKDADISANAEASLIATWYEYTPVSALDIGITMNAPNVTPAAVKNDLA
jgi:type II secretion system (T2SS) protein G